MIYFVKANDRIKIGYSSNPTSRINQLQTSSPYDLEVLLIIDGDREKERILHKEFKDCRKKGEWFEFEGTVKDYIDTNSDKDRKYEFGFCYEDFAGNEQLLRLRTQGNIRTKDLGKRVGISQQAASALISREKWGEISLKNMQRIGDALGYKFEYRFINKTTLKPLEPTLGSYMHLWDKVSS